MSPRHPKKPTRFDSIPPGASFEDDVQFDQLRQPWSLTFGEFLRLVRERYGITEHRHRDQRPYLRSPAGAEIPLPGLAVEDPLDPEETATLCLVLGLPMEDFGLPDDESD